MQESNLSRTALQIINLQKASWNALMADTMALPLCRSQGKDLPDAWTSNEDMGLMREILYHINLVSYISEGHKEQADPSHSQNANALVNKIPNKRTLDKSHYA